METLTPRLASDLRSNCRGCLSASPPAPGMVSLVATEPEAPLQVSGPFPTILLFFVMIPTRGVGTTSEVIPDPGDGVGKATPVLPFHDVVGGTVEGQEPAEVGLR